MKCLICGSEDLQTVDTVISDFVMSRIDPHFEPERRNTKTTLCFCRSCTFAFYAYRFTPEEEALLYRNYRDAEYQKARERYECWYTEKVNAAINRGDVQRQQERIKALLSEHVHNELRTALDYGGNEGTTFCEGLGTEERFVYDISGVKPVPGVTGIESEEELYLHRYDLILCNMVFEHLAHPMEVLEKLRALGDEDTVYYLEVPSENPFVSGNKFSPLKNLSLLLDRNYSWYRLGKYYFQQRKQPFMPMKEHINFFTPASLRIMAERGGFTVPDVREFRAGNSVVLSALLRRNGGQTDTGKEVP